MKRPYRSFFLIGALKATSHVGAYNIVKTKRTPGAPVAASPKKKTTPVLKATPCPLAASVVWEAFQQKKPTAIAAPQKSREQLVMEQQQQRRRRPSSLLLLPSTTA
jgi:hypothetical protein